MTKEAYCSLEVAKLLKEKEFLQDVNPRMIQNLSYYDNIGLCHNLSKYYDSLIQDKIDFIIAPTHQMACAWLREKHNILISIIPQEVKVGVSKLCYAIYRIAKDVYIPLYNGYINNLVDPYEDAVEAALKYSLENLL